MDLLIIGIVVVAVIILLSKSKKDTSTPTPVTEPVITKAIPLTTYIPSPITPYITDYVDGVYENIPPGSWGLSIRHMGQEAAKFNPTDTYIDLTGLETPYTNQYANRASRPSLVFQTMPNEWTSFIDTSLCPPRSIIGGGQHSIMEYIFNRDVKPFSTKNDILNISCDLAIPYGKFDANGIAQLSFVSYFRDKNGSIFAIVIALYDNRFSSYKATVMNDTSVAFVSTPISTNQYITKTNKSAPMTNGTYDDYHFYEVNISYENFTNIINSLNAYVAPQKEWKGVTFDTDILSYEITQVGVLHEVFVNNNNSNVSANAIRGKNLVVNRFSV